MGETETGPATCVEVGKKCDGRIEVVRHAAAKDATPGNLERGIFIAALRDALDHEDLELEEALWAETKREAT